MALRRPYSTSRNSSNRFVVVTAAVYFDSFIEAMLTFFEEINIKPTKRLLCDMRRIENLELSPYQLSKLTELYISRNNGARAVILSPTKPLFQISKAFERRVPEDKRDFKIFQSVDDSNKWLENRKS